ncbi:MAG: hypothetical protein K8U57_04395 [Planctomycetes bacterium]|nr:hypothetical protein [Planctomycetota bacterium]
MTPTDFEIGDDLEFTEQPLLAAGGGTWVIGRIAGHRFEALVFAAHADHPEWELGDSRISKLWVQRLPDKRVVFNWDRGLDVPAADARTQQVVDFLAAWLAEHIHGT